MTKAGRKVGGILAIVGGVITFVVLFFWFGILMQGWIDYTETTIQCFTSMALAGVAITGGILTLKDKTVGGVLALIAGAILLVGWIIPLGHVNAVIEYGWSANVKLTQTFFIDPIIALVGGILGVAVSSEY